jgi:uncharacterized protein
MKDWQITYLGDNSMKLPIFKYNPDPVKLQVIKHSKTKCPVCNEEREFVYEGPFYSIEKVEGVCPWCISSGAAALKYNGFTQDPSNCEDVNNPIFLDELVRRTPGYFGWQQERWLSHCGDFCAVIAYVGWEEVKHLEHELNDEIQDYCETFNISRDEFKEELGNGYMQGYLFRCLQCEKHRIYIDLS